MYYEKYCKTCKKNSHCCIFEKKDGFTFVGIKDAERIKKKTGKEFSTFLDYSPLPKKVVTLLMDDDPCLEGTLRFSQLDKKKSILRLKTKEKGRCIFLDHNGKCSVYSVRPNVCRIYPFWAMKLINGKIKVIPHDSNPRCSVIVSLTEKDEDVENVFSKRQIVEIKKLFSEICRENEHYKNNIRTFVSTHLKN